MITLRESGYGVEPGTETNNRVATGWQFRLGDGAYYLVAKCNTCKELKAIRIDAFVLKGCMCKRVHGESGRGATQQTPAYRTWAAMKLRCYNKNHEHYRFYGGRGISVCERWRQSYRNFLQDMGPRPTGTTLDRIDNDGPYSPDNCRWATKQEQVNNSRSVRLLTFDGQTRSISEWARVIGIQDGTIRYRLKKGWSIEQALTAPLQNQGRTT